MLFNHQFDSFMYSFSCSRYRYFLHCLRTQTVEILKVRPELGNVRLKRTLY